MFPYISVMVIIKKLMRIEEFKAKISRTHGSRKNLNMKRIDVKINCFFLQGYICRGICVVDTHMAWEVKRTKYKQRGI
jgi:hypothetical protein